MSAERPKTSLVAVWFPTDEPWQYRVIDQLPPGIDHAQLERALALTPSERIDAVIELMSFAADLKASVEARPKR